MAPTRKLALLCISLLFTLSACAPSAFVGHSAAVTTEPSGEPATPGPSPSTTATSFQPLPPTATWTPEPTNTPTTTSTPTSSPTPTSTPTLVPTPTWTVYEAGSVKAPILLYHHIANIDPPNRYYVPPDVFRDQMETIKSEGYTPITISQLVDVLINGGELPPQPVVISFDDGDDDIYANAFPVMQELGFPGTMYIISNWVGVVHYLNAEQIMEMASAGWEVGSHSVNHMSLVADHNIVRREVLQSRVDLEKTLGIKVNTFAYPFGLTDNYVSTKAQDYGYRAAVGLGTLNQHTWGTLYYLNRREVQSNYDMAAFLKLLD